MNLLFFLGRKPALSLAELRSVLPRYQATILDEAFLDDVALIEAPEDIAVETLQKSLGGTIKIAHLLMELPTDDKEDVLARISDMLAESGKKVTYTITSRSKFQFTREDMYGIKRTLKEQGIPSRYLAMQQGGLSAASLSHHTIHEIYVLTKRPAGASFLAKTIAVQDIDDWSKRDMGKPYRDPHRGMLPPKLARILVNLLPYDATREQVRILDPFCGTGTVLMEAMLSGYDVVGSDMAKEATDGTEKNLVWLKTQYELNEITTAVVTADATHLTVEQTQGLVDAIVTEPFLGKPNPKPMESDNILKGLEKLYIGAFKQLSKVLKPQGYIVIAMPELHFGNSVKTLKRVIDMLPTLGYTLELGPLIYDRPQTIVKRAIYILKKTKVS